MGSLDSYLPIFFMIVLGIAFAGLSFVASKMLAPQRPTSAKEAPYECGIVPSHEPAQRFPVRFYLIAMIFVVVDIEIIFIFPWAVDSAEPGPLRPGGDPRVRRLGLRPARLPRRQRRPRLGPAQAGAARRDRARPEPRPRPCGASGRRAAKRRRARRSRGTRGPPPQLPHGLARGAGEVGAPLERLAGHLRPRVLRDRDDGGRRGRLRPGPLRDGGLPRLAPPGRPHGRRRAVSPRRWRPCCARSTTRWSSRSGSSRWACAPRPAACSTTTPSSRASTRSCPSTSTPRAARRARRRSSTPS